MLKNVLAKNAVPIIIIAFQRISQIQHPQRLGSLPELGTKEISVHPIFENAATTTQMQESQSWLDVGRLLMQ
jgi:hypothetical protein